MSESDTGGDLVNKSVSESDTLLNLENQNHTLVNPFLVRVGVRHALSPDFYTTFSHFYNYFNIYNFVFPEKLRLK